MSCQEYYNAFNENIGECVEIRCHDGSVHRGYIERVDDENVYLRPMGNELEDFGGPGHGTYFFGFGFGLAAIALASIAAWGFYPFFW